MSDQAPPTSPLPPIVAEVEAGYAFEGPALELGALALDADTVSSARVRIPLGMINRHGLVAGATGTGKTKTLQLLAEQLSAQGVPVFAADIKGDLSGLATPGAGGARLTARAASVGQDWVERGFPVEYFALGGEGTGIPLRATMTSFGPTLLAKVLGLNATQESSLGLVFHYADGAGLPLLDLADLRAVVGFLVSDEGKADLKGLGGLSSATAGVILRELITFEDQGADQFFGEPEFDTADLLRTTADGLGVISLVELPHLQDRPAVFSTFLMWLLADLFHDLPELGDPEKPSLVFFFDEAHLLFADAVTQSPTDVPDDVLAQLGSRVQHQLRAATPNDAKALRATVDTYPTSSYDDLGKIILSLGIGEAVVTVMDERGAPTPVAWTRLRAPQSLMAPSSPDAMAATVGASSLAPRYAVPVDRESARELLAARLEAGAAAAEAEREPAPPDRDDRPAPAPRAPRRAPGRSTSGRGGSGGRDTVQDILTSPVARDLARTAAREIVRGVFGIGRRRR
jgi:DNA helicase HerA-like ATPase